MDANGNLILDANGQPIPVLVNVTTFAADVARPARLASPRFFSRFNPGGTHAGWLTPRRIEADLGMAGHWRTVFQRPVCGAAGLTDTLEARASPFDNLVEDRDSDRPETDDGNSLRSQLVLAALALRAAR